MSTPDVIRHREQPNAKHVEKARSGATCKFCNVMEIVDYVLAI